MPDSWYKVDNAVRQTSFFHQLHEVVVGQSCGLSRFPDNGVAHDCRSSGQVAADGGKVEWRDCHYKAIERTVLTAVPYAVGVFRLLAVDLLSKGNVVAQEVSKLASRVNLSLESGLALPSMVAAFIFARHGPASRSAAFRKMEALCSQGIFAHSSFAAIAASAASLSSVSPAMLYSART